VFTGSVVHHRHRNIDKQNFILLSLIEWCKNLMQISDCGINERLKSEAEHIFSDCMLEIKSFVEPNT